jgi:phosphoglycolate phosphatase-like HAD superfamily hydrolase
VWDWNGTLVNDLPAVVHAMNAALASVGGPQITEDDHRRDFRRPVVGYYAYVLGRPVDIEEFAHLDRVFHEAYQVRRPSCQLTTDAEPALRAWVGSQSLLSMWFHDELVPAVDGYGLTRHFARIDGLRRPLRAAFAHKEPYLAAHLAALQLDGVPVVLIGDTVDDAHAATAVGAGCVLYAGGFTDPDQLRATRAPVADTLVEAVALARTS